MWLLLASASAFFSAAAAVAQKKILFRIDAVAFSFMLSIVLMGFSIGTMSFTDVLHLSSITLIIIIVKSIINAAAFLFVMMALQRGGISSTLPLLALTPGVTALLAYGALGEKISGYEILGLLFMIAGVFLLERNEFAASNDKQWFDSSRWYIGSALLLFAISSVFDKYLVSGIKTPPLVVLFYQHAVFLLLYGGLYFRKCRPLRSLYRTRHETDAASYTCRSALYDGISLYAACSRQARFRSFSAGCKTYFGILGGIGWRKNIQ